MNPRQEDQFTSLPERFCDSSYGDMLVAIQSSADHKRIHCPSIDINISRWAIDGEAFIIRSLKTLSTPEALNKFKRRVLGLYRAIGQPGLEQVVAYSMPDDIIVTKDAGTALSQLSPETINNITVDHLNSLFSTLERMYELRLIPDVSHADNCTFIPVTGFTVVDFEAARSIGVTPLTAFRRLMEESTSPYYQPSKEYKAAWGRVGTLAINIYKQNCESVQNDTAILERHVARLLSE